MGKNIVLSVPKYNVPLEIGEKQAPGRRQAERTAGPARHTGPADTGVYYTLIMVVPLLPINP